MNNKKKLALACLLLCIVLSGLIFFPSADASAASAYQLQENLVQNSSGEWVTSGGAWDDDYDRYNCYAYAIRRFENLPFYPTDFDQYQPGSFSVSPPFDDSTGNVYAVADIVVDDLEALGYTNVVTSSTIPSINTNQALICIRTGIFFEEPLIYDYHLMRYDISTNAWYHKPGSSAILKYKFIPSNERLWHCESSNGGE